MLTSALVFDLPVIRQWAKESCDPMEQSDEMTTLNSSPDDEQVRELRERLGNSYPIIRICRSLSILLAHVLVISLLDTSLDSARLYFDKDWIEKHEVESRICSQIFEALRWSACKACELSTIVQHMIELLGHVSPPNKSLQLLGQKDPPNELDKWLGTSRRGQVLLSKLLLDVKIQNAPCYQFICVPGVLSVYDRPKGEIFEAVTSTEAPFTDYNPIPVPSTQIGFLTRFASLEHEWLYRILPNRLQVNLNIKNHVQAFSRSDLRSAFRACGQVIFIPPCGHDRDHVKPARLEDHVFVPPDDFLKGVPHAGFGKVLVYAVRGNDPLRLMIIGALEGSHEDTKIGFSRYACLQCSLDVCRKQNLWHLIC